jgi:hypothetical protein
MGHGYERRLSARRVAALVKTGRYCDGGGLYLKIDGGNRRWLYRYTFAGRAREIGLGGAAVSLADARRARDKWRKVLNEGRDPLVVRGTERAGGKMFGEVAEGLIGASLMAGAMPSIASSGVRCCEPMLQPFGLCRSI